jgi:hypothetical protein
MPQTHLGAHPDCYDTYILFLGLRVVYVYEATYDPQYQVAVT